MQHSNTAAVQAGTLENVFFLNKTLTQVLHDHSRTILCNELQSIL